jgi:two-component system sensor kinase FixL
MSSLPFLPRPEPAAADALGRGALTRLSGPPASTQPDEALDRRLEFLRQVIDADPNFVSVKDGHGRFTLVNRALAELYGTSVTRMIGRTDADFSSGAEDVEASRRVDLEVMRSLEQRFIPEERIIDAAGTVRYLQTVKRPIVGPDGRAAQVLGVSTDITRRKQAELELQRDREELAHLARVSTMGELVGSLAHELKHPLTALIANASAAQRCLERASPDMTELREILTDIVDDSRRAADVIEQSRSLLEKKVEFGTIDLPDLARSVVRLAHGNAARNSVRVVLDCEPGLPAVHGDKVQLQQVVLNLLLNAFDSVAGCPGAGREVHVLVRRSPRGTVTLSCMDRGTGLPPETLARLFQPFFTTKRHGLGLGLAISRSIVQNHGGRLWAENNDGQGATFFIALPLSGHLPA